MIVPVVEALKFWVNTQGVIIVQKTTQIVQMTLWAMAVSGRCWIFFKQLPNIILTKQYRCLIIFKQLSNIIWTKQYTVLSKISYLGDGIK